VELCCVLIIALIVLLWRLIVSPRQGAGSE